MDNKLLTTQLDPIMPRPLSSETDNIVHLNRLMRMTRDSVIITRRNLTKYRRVPSLLVFSTIQPIMFLLLFTYVFGGAVKGVGGSYVNFLVPGILIQAVTFGCTQTGVGLADDMQKGMMDRFRSLPMARSAVLAGRTLSDSLRNFFVVVLMIGVGYIIGFRFQAGIVPGIAAMLIAVGFGFSLTWVSALVGLYAKDAESAGVLQFIWIFPLTFASSAFVPIATMPGWLQAFARVNPISNAVLCLRALSNGGPTLDYLIYTLMWIFITTLIASSLAVTLFRRRSR